MDLSNIREGELREIFDALEEAFGATGVDYYVIGALAKDIWYAKGDIVSRQTKDVDFAVLVGSMDDYEAIRSYLKENKKFIDTKTNAFVMLSPSSIQVDILPFGEIEINDSVMFAGVELDSIKVNGFMEVYNSGTEGQALETGHQFKVATLPSIILLKLIAYDDRPEQRSKDARDIADIIHHFFELHPTLIYSEEHFDLFSEDVEDKSLQEISATVIGREIKKIISSNQSLTERLIRILQDHIEQEEESPFVKNMIAETGETIEHVMRQLKNVLSGLID
ncbi:MAG: nucleotidyl transferase AbiEii/AbiGii toxin family protein [Sediminibacterium magnilacihabitans]|jgi:predicted nucleotidyltransferase|nr:nucleotidyl transferase AbiEii/AbiGii toxin family protein [Sediminibacterium magnilacihabitans]PQV61726.1 putative nucleotidyltransferase [Sediminibacterium magnilacihabitans]